MTTAPSRKVTWISLWFAAMPAARAETQVTPGDSPVSPKVQVEAGIGGAAFRTGNPRPTGDGTTPDHSLGLWMLEVGLGAAVDENDSGMSGTLTVDCLSRGYLRADDPPESVVDATGLAAGFKGSLRRRFVHASLGVGLGILHNPRYRATDAGVERGETTRLRYAAGNVGLGLSLYHSRISVIDLVARLEARRMLSPMRPDEGFEATLVAPAVLLAWSVKPEVFIDNFGRAACGWQCAAPGLLEVLYVAALISTFGQVLGALTQ